MSITEFEKEVTGVLCNLKWNLDARGIHYTDFAEDMDVAVRTVHNWFKNYGAISAKKAFEIIHYFEKKGSVKFEVLEDYPAPKNRKKYNKGAVVFATDNEDLRYFKMYPALFKQVTLNSKDNEATK